MNATFPMILIAIIDEIDLLCLYGFHERFSVMMPSTMVGFVFW